MSKIASDYKYVALQVNIDESLEISSSLQQKPSLKSFRKALSNEDVSIEKSFHAVYDTCFCLSVQFTARFVHTFFPTHIRESMDLRLKLVLLIFHH